MLVIRAGIHKTLVRIANREDLDQISFQKQSKLGLCCLSKPYWQATSVQNFRTITIRPIPFWKGIHDFLDLDWNLKIFSLYLFVLYLFLVFS